MARRPPASSPRRRAARGPSSAKRAPDAGRTRLFELLDDKVEDYTVSDWRDRNLSLSKRLADLGLIDREIVPPEAHRALTESLIHVLNGAATDPQNAGHVRAQNENIVHYGLHARLSPKSLTIALEAGFIHDLNKAIGEPLRQDELGVRDPRGRLVPAITTMAQSVGLNHLGERTRAAIVAATRLKAGALAPEVAKDIDRCIVHHGLGSSRFIQDLLEGKNAWWGAEFVDPNTGERRLIHPEQPPLTLESVVHDLADSTQQMQGGAAWLLKYPAGFWRASQRSLADMLSGGDGVAEDGIPMSLRLQSRVETATCNEIIDLAEKQAILDSARGSSLRKAVTEATASSERWICDSADYLADPGGMSVYHDVGRALGTSAEDAHGQLAQAIIGSAQCDVLERLVWESAARVDRDRARSLADRIQKAAASQDGA